VIRRVAPVLMLLAVACGGGPGAPMPKDTATTPENAVREFMQAVADSNITMMGRYWGTAHGPATETHQPADYVQRLAVTQAFLRHSPYRILRTDPVVGDPARQSVQVELDRTDLDGSRCTRSAPFTIVNVGKRGWIVTAIDLTLVGTPGRACASPAKTAP
jgi:hypothetical protein